MIYFGKDHAKSPGRSLYVQRKILQTHKTQAIEFNIPRRDSYRAQWRHKLTKDFA